MCDRFTFHASRLRSRCRRGRFITAAQAILDGTMPTHLEIVTIERKVCSEDVDMVIAPGSEGELGILPNHTPLLTTLTEGVLRVKRGGEEEVFAIGGGVHGDLPNKVIVLAGG